jgi:serine protease Do
MNRLTLGLFTLATVLTITAHAQDRKTKVQQDKEQLADSATWIYNDLDRGLAEAKRSNKPLAVVLRCIPCEACSEFDKHLLARDNEVRDLFDKFVCVRIVQANGLDLSLFQFDYDQSFHAMFLNADKTIYGRFGTRSARPENDDMTMKGLRQAMLAALELHKNYPANKAQLAGKQGRPVEISVPEELPGLKGKYTKKLDYEGKLVASCIHCHQIRDSERDTYRKANKTMPAEVLFPYPLPDVLGLSMDPNERAAVKSVAEGSIAAKAGLKPGDKITTLAGQPILAIADVQWVLHHAPSSGEIPAEIERDGRTQKTTMSLPSGWRQKSDISFRATTWELRRMATGGLVLEDVSDADRRKHGLADDVLALRVKHVGEYNEHAAAKQAGFKKNDIVIAAADRTARMTEGQFIAAALDNRRGTKLAVTVLRGDDRVELQLPMQ